MIRAFWIIARIAIVIAIGIWLVEHPGVLRVDWFGYVVETTVAVALVALVVLIAVCALAYRLYRALVRTPRRYARWSRGRRRERGLRALSRGWVAVAAGDAPAARRHAEEAERMLRDRELTELLSAQAAQLSGDDRSADARFRAMMEKPETAFLGVRGLLNKAMREGDRDEALRLARRAHDLRPRTPWVLGTLFDLEARAGNWERAQQALDEGERVGTIPADDARRHRAAVLLERSFEAELDGREAEALTFAGRSHDLQPAFAPAAARVARLLARAGRHKHALRAVERAWKLEPHPDLAAAYRDVLPETDALARVKRFERLLSLSPDRYDGHVALAEAALKAKLWGEARNHLAKALAIRPSARVYGLLADLAQQEHGDAAAAREWLEKAASAPRDAFWACERCNTPSAHWRGICPGCGSFDTLEWRIMPEPAGTLLPVDAPRAAVPAGNGAGPNGAGLYGSGPNGSAPGGARNGVAAAGPPAGAPKPGAPLPGTGSATNGSDEMPAGSPSSNTPGSPPGSPPAGQAAGRPPAESRPNAA
ncbi:heme biosynthesis protein HemY [Arenibaculum pallidiluteum]|uniref:heme biosynthesis protein HemY n=1 Tax=Arenibaculum pallidiluteum TaxID=2812559 RepID=UPI001A977EB9|nr:heme biosynthesis HemY N-terminal domain-containing protein [Arenibaculum pallidiluteum]